MSRELLVRETLRLPWNEVLSHPLAPTKVLVARDPADVIGVVVPLRGRWWGMTIVRCDRSIPREIADARGTGRYADFDAAMRWLGLEVAKAVRRTVDVTAELGDAIVLAGDETMWVPSNATLYSEACFKSGDRSLVVSAYERTRSDRRARIVQSDVREAVPEPTSEPRLVPDAVRPLPRELHVERMTEPDKAPPQLPKVIVHPSVADQARPRSREAG